ncbi:MAG TPA: CopG family transcriptional regulator [Gammaproteobacteria bacterium]|nr:CopG family transcriptional regulator [Gammaproteobacteria bacterium]
MEQRTARLTILIDPRKKAVFEKLCAEVDLTTSQVIRKLIRDYIEYRTGKPWQPDMGAIGTRKRSAKKK